MDDFRLGPVAPSGSYSERQPPNSSGRGKARPARRQYQTEDQVILEEAGDEKDGGGDYYSPSGGNRGD